MNICKKVLLVIILLILLLIGLWYTNLFHNSLNVNIENYTIIEENTIEENISTPDIPEIQINTDLFEEYYIQAEEKIKTMSLDEKIAQMYIIGTTSITNYSQLDEYQFGGHLYVLDAFKYPQKGSTSIKTVSKIREQIATSQSKSKIPLLMAIDEEGETISRLNSTLYEELKSINIMTEPFKNSSDLFASGGFEAIENDTIYKSNILKYLGFNLNFAPCIDISDSDTYMYKRTLKQDAETTAQFARTIIQTSKSTDVSYTLKHFPGYGNSIDTHSGFATDNRPLSDFENKDLIPFKAGIDADAEVIMVSHNIITCLDSNEPASISKPIHDYLRNNMNFTGIIITDAINMDAVSKIYSTEDSVIKAIQAGNDMICLVIEDDTILTYSEIIQYVKNAVSNGQISEETINTAVKRIIAWKYYKGLIQD